MRIAVIGGTGHVGTYLVPRLVEQGHDVVVVSRGQKQPYQPHGAWERVQRVTFDRKKAEEEGTFGERIAQLEAEVVVDMICFKPDQAAQLVEALRGKVEHFLHCGTIWVHGHSVELPTTEDVARRPLGDYGTNKAAIEAMLQAETRTGGLPCTVVHAGHIVGPGWVPINPAGHNDPVVFGKLARGEEVALPHFGMETLHHVHADDVAQVFVAAISSWSASAGESFHAVSPRPVTLRGYAEAVAGWFGREAHLRFLPWDQWAAGLDEKLSGMTKDHILHSPNCSIEKARRLLGFEPRYTSLEAIREAVHWLVVQGRIDIGSS